MKNEIALTEQKIIDINKSKAKKYFSETIEKISIKKYRLKIFSILLISLILTKISFEYYNDGSSLYITLLMVLTAAFLTAFNRIHKEYEKKIKSLICVDFILLEMLIYRRRLILKNDVVIDPLKQTACANTEYEILRMFHTSKNIEILYVEEKLKELTSE